jgi:hypothetical protein
MSRHIDLIALAVLLIALAFVSRVQDAVHLTLNRSGIFRLHASHPLIVVPHMPAVPRVARLPLVQY